MRRHRDLVAHGATGNENCCFLSGHLRRQCFELGNRRVVQKDIVAEDGGLHRRVHLRTRARDGVGPQIDPGLLTQWDVRHSALKYD